MKDLIKLPQIEFYLLGFVLMYLVKIKECDKAKVLSTDMIKRILVTSSRNLDSILAFTYFYFARCSELLGELKLIRPQLFEAYRRSCLKRDEIGQATIINLLLRNYIKFKDYSFANQLMGQSSFPENKSNNQNIRYLYYTALIKAVQMEYGEAFARVMQAIRKAPQKGLGFKIAAQKLGVVVELLLGQIPNRNLFSKTEYLKPLFSYYKLCQAVWKGDLGEYMEVVKKYSRIYEKDQLLILIRRLSSNVIKTGLRRINASYSRISFKDVAAKLNLQENTDVEFIIAKAIRDGVIRATISHQEQHITIVVRLL